MSYDKKVFSGLEKIHVAKLNADGTYAIPTPILGAKSANVEFSTSSKPIYADNRAVHNLNKTSSGEGTASVLGLTLDEMCLLSGEEKRGGAFALSDGADAPSFSILAEEKVGDGTKNLYAIYNAQFANLADISLTTEEEDIDETNQELKFSCSLSVFEVDGKSYFYQKLNTGDADADATMIANWFTEVQKPASLASGTY